MGIIEYVIPGLTRNPEGNAQQSEHNLIRNNKITIYYITH